MARRPVVSRHITCTVCTVELFNKLDGTVGETEVTLPRVYKTEQAMEYRIQSRTPSAFKLLSIKDWKVVTKHCYMPEEDFFDMATTVSEVTTKRKPSTVRTTVKNSPSTSMKEKEEKLDNE